MNLLSIVVLVVAVILSMSVHELAHGLVSYWFGDPTAKMEGRLSLNPFRHIDWMGLVCLLVFKIGWAKPVPIDSRYYKDQKSGIIWTSFAGPIANFILSFLCILIMGLMYKFIPYFAMSEVGIFIIACLDLTSVISVGFGIFNLLPIPPLDGSKILFSFLPDDQYYRIIQGSPYLNLVFILLLVSGILTTPIMMLRGSILEIFQNIVLMLF